MSFLSSHRLHWGVHHELSENFRLQLDKIEHDAAAPAESPQQASASADTPTDVNPPGHADTVPRLDSLAP